MRVLLLLAAVGGAVVYYLSRRWPPEGDRVSEETLGRLRCLEGGDANTFDAENVTRPSLRVARSVSPESPSAPKAYSRAVGEGN